MKYTINQSQSTNHSFNQSIDRSCNQSMVSLRGQRRWTEYDDDSLWVVVRYYYSCQHLLVLAVAWGAKTKGNIRGTHSWLLCDSCITCSRPRYLERTFTLCTDTLQPDIFGFPSAWTLWLPLNWAFLCLYSDFGLTLAILTLNRFTTMRNQ